MMRDALGAAYAALLRDLESRLRAEFSWTAPETAFGSYVFSMAQDEPPVAPLSDFIWPTEERLVHAPALASVGYWLACGVAGSLRNAWLDGTERLSRRDAFPSDRQSFVYRPIELLGVAAGVGVCATDKPDLARWVREILDRLNREPKVDAWTANLRLAAEAALLPLPAASRIHPVEALPDIALARWLRISRLATHADKDEDEALLTAGLTQSLDQSSTAEAALVYHSLRSTIRCSVRSTVDEHWQVNRTQRDAEELVTHLCRRFHLLAQQIRSRHAGRTTIDINDEYDVQDLMRSLLCLHFDDVRPEEVTPSMGGKSGRMDFLLKRERVVVETKMTRKTLQQKEVGDELIIDMKRYSTHPDCQTLICFVYDPGGYCSTPTALEDDLSGNAGPLRTRVIVCPKGT